MSKELEQGNWLFSPERVELRNIVMQAQKDIEQLLDEKEECQKKIREAQAEAEQARKDLAGEEDQMMRKWAQSDLERAEEEIRFNTDYLSNIDAFVATYQQQIDMLLRTEADEAARDIHLQKKLQTMMQDFARLPLSKRN